MVLAATENTESFCLKVFAHVVCNMFPTKIEKRLSFVYIAEHRVFFVAAYTMSRVWFIFELRIVATAAGDMVCIDRWNLSLSR